MTYEDLLPYLTKKHIYANVTTIEAVNCPVDKAITELRGVTYLGTDSPYPGMESKELIASDPNAPLPPPPVTPVFEDFSGAGIQ